MTLHYRALRLLWKEYWHQWRLSKVAIGNISNAARIIYTLVVMCRIVGANMESALEEQVTSA